MSSVGRGDSERARAGPTLGPGDLVGDKYRIKRELGQGGSATVYEAEHIEIGHVVAIKVVHRDLATHTRLLQRFRHEARVCARIRDRHIAEVFDVGEVAGLSYMVMEYMEGNTLAARLEGGRRLSLEAVVELGRQVLSGLHAAHRAEVVHRDVKPENLMLCVDHSGEVLVKLLDFGIARQAHLDTGNRITMEGIVVGTPDYMPPEQLRGESVDERTDIYALGTVLYEALTGRPPFEGRTVSDVVAAVVRDAITPPRELRPECPSVLERILLRATSKDADGRYGSAHEMEAALARLAHTEAYGRGNEVWALDYDRSSGPAPRSDTHPSAELLMATVATGPTFDDDLGVAQRTVGRDDDTSTTNAHFDPGPGSDWAPAPRQGLSKGGAATLLKGPVVWMTVGALVTGVVVWALFGADPYVMVAPPEELETAPVTEQPPPEPTSAVSPAAEESGHAPEALTAPVPVPSIEGQEEPLRAEPAEPAEPAERVQPTERTQRIGRTKLASQDSDPRGPEDLVSAAIGAFASGDSGTARSLYLRATRQNPRYAPAWRGLGTVASRMGRRAEARRAFERYLVLAPDAPDAARIRERLQAL